jgi:N-acetylglutamate synthase-like GNAT family acetyltransferase
MITIRFADKQDLPAISELYADYQLPNVRMSKEFINAAIEKFINNKNCVLFYLNDILIGGVACDVSQCDITHDTICQAMLLYIKDPHRHHTAQCIQKLEEFCKEKTNIKRLIFAAPEGDYGTAGLARFYSIHGYKPLETHYFKDLS